MPLWIYLALVAHFLVGLGLNGIDLRRDESIQTLQRLRDWNNQGLIHVAELSEKSIYNWGWRGFFREMLPSLINIGFWEVILAYLIVKAIPGWLRRLGRAIWRGSKRSVVAVWRQVN